MDRKEENELDSPSWKIIHGLVRIMIPHVKYDPNNPEAMARDASLGQSYEAQKCLDLLLEKFHIFDERQKSFIRQAVMEYRNEQN